MSIILSTLISFLLSSNFINFEIANITNELNLSSTYIAKTVVSAANNNTKEDAPLIITRTITQSELKDRKALKSEEILTQTNKERVKLGLKPLIWNAKLSSMADYKCKDMINKKYFAHVAPNGNDVTDLAKMKSYEYSLIGENLAMGDFLSSNDVVDGWMKSPGHRANILKPTYTEIGISATSTFINGKISWYAVQEFGRPSPTCLKPNQKTETYIKNSNILIKNVNTVLSDTKSQIEKETDLDKRRKLINSYNSLGSLANILYDRTKQAVYEYNASINTYNNCLKIEDKIISTK